MTRNPHPCLEPEQRPGSAPLYGRLCYGVHTLPSLRDYYYQAGPLQASVQLPPPGRRHPAAAPIVRNQPVQQGPPEAGRASVLAAHTLSRLTGRTEDGTKMNVDIQKQDRVKVTILGRGGGNDLPPNLLFSLLSFFPPTTLRSIYSEWASTDSLF